MRSTGPFSKLSKPSKTRIKGKSSNRIKRSPEQRREEALRKKYGISIAEYEKMFIDQKGVCWICGKPPKKRRLNVDHDHKTGKVRGLLCFTCNWGLSWFKDNADKLEKAAAYLRRQIVDPKDFPILPDVSAIHFEWANNRWGTIYDHIEIAAKNAGGKIPVVCSKQIGQDWIAIIPLDEFIKLIKFYRPTQNAEQKDTSSGRDV